MKKLMLLTLLLALFTTHAFAATKEDIIAGAKIYSDDAAMLSMVDSKKIKAVGTYCRNGGEEIVRAFGTNQPLLFDLGLKNQTAYDYTAACNTFVEILPQMKADDARALAYLIGVAAHFDVKNKYREMTTMAIVEVPAAYASVFGRYDPLEVIGGFVAVTERQPEGYPEEVLSFLRPLFLARPDAALKALQAARPDDRVKKVIKLMASAIWNEKDIRLVQ